MTNTLVTPQLTPLMQQYYNIKENHKDHILFFRLGDFYEMFGDDAHKAAPILEVALTHRQKIPMCGIPHHAANQYIAKLIKKGLCVAICEQITGENSTSSKNLFTRKVVHTITPGTLLEENLLTAQTNNYLASLCVSLSKNNSHAPLICIAFSDISTGEFLCAEFTDTKGLPNLSTQLSIHQPKEIIVLESIHEQLHILDLLKNNKILIHTAQNTTNTRIPERILSPDIEQNQLAKTCCSLLINYITKTRPQAIDALKPIRLIKSDHFIQLDETVVRNLELLEGLSSRSREGSLLEVLDYTSTSMGARNLKNWILHPLVNKNEIIKRQQAISFFLDQPMVRADIKNNLKDICDLERTLNRLITGSANARDLNAIKDSLFAYAKLRSILKSNSSTTIKMSLDPWFHAMDAVPEAAEQIQSTIVDSPPISIKDGEIIRPLFNAELDELHEAVSHGKDWISALEKKEREKTGIPKLKIGYTSVFGYYLEVTKSHLSKVPPEYHRKQTLTNAERFITPELKSMEDKILGSETKSHHLEYLLFCTLRDHLLSFASRIQKCAETTAILDTFISLAEAAAHNDYNFPEITEDHGISIVNGRHPVIEKSVREEGGFIPNDCTLNDSNSLWVITGPNMSGKSTFLRQTALIVLIAQIGSPVPARTARIGIIDRIFTRIGSSDNLSKNQSTFMVEMHEMAYILNNLSSRSLIILDEIGRGTSTYDGISIARAVIEYLHNKNPKPLVLFATHYFELTELSVTLPTVTNYNVDVKEWQNKILFLHKIVLGSADRSYGVHVADLAGLPKDIISRAQIILQLLESNSLKNAPSLDTHTDNQSQMSFYDMTHPLFDELRALNINQLTPLSALQLLAEWKERI